MPSNPTARVFNIQKYSIYDGPGIRTIVFFQGCPLSCLWCSNPEGQTARPQILLSRNLCTLCGACVKACPNSLHAIKGDPPVHILSHEGCTGCGACVEACPNDALAQCGSEMTLEQIMDVVLEDREFYETSGGGMTASGGEPLSQAEALEALFSSCRNEGISTAIETSGFAPHAVLERVAPLTKLFLYDLKHMDDGIHKKLTGVSNRQILENLAWLLDNEYAVRVRMPLINGCNTDDAEIAARVRFLLPWKGSVGFRGWISCPITRWASKSTNSSTCPTASTTGLRLVRKLWNVYGNSLTKPAFPSPSSAINGVFSNTGKNEHNDILGLSSDRYPL